MSFWASCQFCEGEAALPVSEAVDRYHAVGEMLSVRGLVEANVELVQIGSLYDWILLRLKRIAIYTAAYVDEISC